MGEATIGKADWRRELERGLSALAAGDDAAAERCFAAAQRAAPDRPEACFALGRALARRGDVEAALPLLERAADDGAGLAAAAGALARLLGLRRGQVARAHELLDRAVACHPGEPRLHVVRAELLLADEHHAEADVALAAARALLDERGGELPSAEEAIAAGLARSRNLEGLELARAGHAEPALFAFKRAHDLLPAWGGPLVNMGAVFETLGRAARARSAYERALLKDPDNAAALFNLGRLHRRRGELPPAEAALRRLLGATPHAGARAALADVLVARGAGAAACALLRSALAAAPADADLWHGLALAEEACGRRAEAELAWRAALAAAPDHVPAAVRLAGLLAGAGRVVEAAALLEYAAELDRERADACA